MKKNNYISAMDKTTLSNDAKNKIKDLYDVVNNPAEEKVMTVNTKKRWRKPLAVVAASLALLIGFDAFSISLPDNGKNDNSFVLTVNAAELKEGAPVLADTSAFGFSISEGDDNFDYYSLDFPVKYKGDNIKSITYSLNKGYFEIYKFKENTIEKQSTHSDSNIQVNDTGKAELSIPADVYVDDSEQVKLESSHEKVKEFTVNYNDQKKAGKYVYIEGDSKHFTKAEYAELKKAVYQESPNDYRDSYEKKMKRECAAINKLLGDLVITSTINFKDGTTKTQNIKVSTKLIKSSEATMDEISPEKGKGSIIGFSFEIV